MKINTGYILSIPLDGIEKAEIAKYDAGLIVILVVVCTLGLVTLVGLVNMNSGNVLNIHEI